MVDFENGTVSALPDTAKEPFDFSKTARDKGAKLVAGVDLAVALDSGDEAFAGNGEAFSGRLSAYSGRLNG
ncbi:hypothetical protein CXZ10_05110 [Pleomorphomonas diazotrophica]|uniref:Uncharacterized protein n=1 Tax=Pleomorphomonas diazotrophica TaxID=1166257 RepID=A0A2N3M1I3_9HYPH|nr:hypothetical protein CXZ10_05110 [Pleomorphomonas diazotrophica]